MTTQAQKRATNKYNADKKVIGCKTTNEKADLLKDYYKSKGYVSANQYLKDLIYKDSGIKL